MEEILFGIFTTTTDLTIEGLNEFVKQFLTKIHVESLIYGNLTKSEALETARLVESKLTKPTRDNVKRCVIPLLPIHLLPYRQVSLDNGNTSWNSSLLHCHY